MAKIGVFGLWHLGCVIAASWSKIGNQVIGYDYDDENINNLKKGIPPLFEPHLEETINESLNKGFLTFTSNINDLSDCDYIFLSYDTPVDEKDNSDTLILINSIIDLKNVLKNNAIVIISSQSPVGYCSDFRDILRNHNPCSTLELAYSPENLRLGDAINCYLNPDRIILGTKNKETLLKCLELFNQIEISDNILCMSLESAEMVKHGINSFLAMSIVFANHLADICSDKGANIRDVVWGLKTDSRIGKKAYLTPGIGFSGGTLGRDLKVLKLANGGGYAKLFETIYELNSERKKSIVYKIEHRFGNLKNKNIGILGLTYKPGTSTLRRSLPIEIINLLYNKEAKIYAFDPKADYDEISNTEKIFNICSSITELIDNCEYLVLLTEWQDFKDFDWSKVNKNISILDTKNFLNINLEKIKYYSI